MIINKTTKLWMTCNKFPDTNYAGWDEANTWVVPDNSELAKKIKLLRTKWNPIVNDTGDLIDVEWNGIELPIRLPQKSQIALINEHINNIEAQLAETDEVAIDLYEASLAQEAINAEQDEAIIEIYEMMEGINHG